MKQNNQFSAQRNAGLHLVNVEMDHKGLKLRQWDGEGKWAKLKFGKLSFLWLALLFSSFSTLGIFFLLFHRETNHNERICQAYQQPFKLMSIECWKCIKYFSCWCLVSEQKFQILLLKKSLVTEESATIVGNYWRCCCYPLLPKNKHSKF